MSDLLEQKAITDEFSFKTFEKCNCIKFKDEQIGDALIGDILHNFTSEQIGFCITMTNGGRIHYIAIKVFMDSIYSLWSITPCHKNEVVKDVTPFFLLGKSLENGKSWLALESKLGKLWSFGVIDPKEITEIFKDFLNL